MEQIGIKSTRLRSVTGEQIIIANADLLKSRVRNLGRASERRALFTLALSYDTPTEKLQLVRAGGRAVASYAGTRFVHCMLRELGESALLYEVCFFIENTPGAQPERRARSGESADPAFVRRRRHRIRISDPYAVAARAARAGASSAP